MFIAVAIGCRVLPGGKRVMTFVQSTDIVLLVDQLLAQYTLQSTRHESVVTQ